MPAWVPSRDRGSEHAAQPPDTAPPGNRGCGQDLRQACRRRKAAAPARCGLVLRQKEVGMSTGPATKTFQEQFEGSEFAGDTDFLLSFEKMIAENPHRHPSDLLFIAESIWRTQIKCVAALAQVKREAAMEERLRIAE